MRRMITPKRILGVVFDMDGTLTKPGHIDFKRMRDRIGLESHQDILGTIKTWNRGKKQTAMKIIEEEEIVALEHCELQPRVEKVFEVAKSLNIKSGILTRNGPHAVDHFLAKVNHNFDMIITRDFEPCKPSPIPLLYICEQWGYSPNQVLMVGDHKDDLECGNSAGCPTILVADQKESVTTSMTSIATKIVNSMEELAHIIERMHHS